MPGGQLESGSQCSHSEFQKTQYIPRWQRHWVLRLLVQGMISTKPSTAGVMRGCSAQWLHSRTSQPPTSTPEHPTHSCHRGGTAGRRQDGSSARCTNSQGMWHRRCSGGGYIRRRRMCLGCERTGGQSGDWGSHSALCCSLHDPGPVPVPT